MCDIHVSFAESLVMLFRSPRGRGENDTLSLHDALPISQAEVQRIVGAAEPEALRRLGVEGDIVGGLVAEQQARPPTMLRSEEHTSELQSQSNLVCRLVLEKKKRRRRQRVARRGTWEGSS